jgi:toxin ParE1/3/4
MRGFKSWLLTIEGAKPAVVLTKIRQSASKLEQLGDIGRPGKVAGTQELSVAGAPYVIGYRVTRDRNEIIAVLHTAQEPRN